MILDAGYIYRDDSNPAFPCIYLYLGDNISVEFVNPKDWRGEESYIGSKLILGGTLGFEECQETYHSGWITNSSGCLPVLYSGRSPEGLCSLDDVMDWICRLTLEDFDKEGFNMIFPWAAVQLSDDGCMHYVPLEFLKYCEVDPLRVLEEMNGQA